MYNSPFPRDPIFRNCGMLVGNSRDLKVFCEPTYLWQIFIGLWFASGRKEQGEQPKWRAGMSNANGRVDAQKWALSAENFVGYGERPFTWVCERKGPSKQINVPYGLFRPQWIAATKPGGRNLVSLPDLRFHELLIFYLPCSWGYFTLWPRAVTMIYCRPLKVIRRLYQGNLRLKYVWSWAFRVV